MSTDAPVRHTAKSRRIKTVMQEMMIKHVGRWTLGLHKSDSSFTVFERHYGQLKTPQRAYSLKKSCHLRFILPAWHKLKGLRTSIWPILKSRI